MQGLDLELSFLDAFVQEEVNAGKTEYNQNYNITSSNVHKVPESTLNLKAYQSE